MAKPWMDFALVREQSDFVIILARYEIAHARQRDQVSMLCPFHDDRQPSLSVSLERKVFHCFACQAKGDILDFVAMMEKVPIPEAARIVAKCCGIPLDGRLAPPRRSPKTTEGRRNDSSAQGRSGEHGGHVAKNSPCCDLTLDPTHRYLFDRGLTPELVEAFGLGHCSKGRLRGRVCIPIHSPDGAQVLAFSGRWANDDVPAGTPRYLMPRGFKKSEVLFNYHRVVGAQHLVIVEGYWSVFRLHALNVPAIALMGTSLSETQLDLLCQSGTRILTLFLDADRAGQRATDDLLPRLSALFFVRTPALPDGESPDTVSEDLLLEAVHS